MNEAWRPPNIKDPVTVGLMRSGTYLFKVEESRIGTTKVRAMPYIYLSGIVVADRQNSELVTYPYLGHPVHIYFMAWINDIMQYRANELGFVLHPDVAEAACQKYVGRIYRIRCKVEVRDYKYNRYDLLEWVNRWEFLE